MSRLGFGRFGYALGFFEVGEHLQKAVVRRACHLLAQRFYRLQPFQIHIYILSVQTMVVILCLCQHDLLKGFFVQQLLQCGDVEGQLLVRTAEHSLQDLLYLRQHDSGHIQAGAHIRDVFGVLQQRCRQLASGTGGTQRRVAALGVGYPDISGDALPCQTALLLAVIAARRRVYRTLELR